MVSDFVGAVLPDDADFDATLSLLMVFMFVEDFEVDSGDLLSLTDRENCHCRVGWIFANVVVAVVSF